MIGVETASNEVFIFREGWIYQANSNYIYDMLPEELKTLLGMTQDILDEYRRGAYSAYTNLAHQSSY